MIQWFIAIVLFFVLLFGIGFILNMLLKTTWFPIYVYILVMLPGVIYSQWNSSQGFWENLGGYGMVDFVTALGGLVGAVLSGMTIKFLRSRGYKMF